MKLADYLSDSKLTQSEFAKRIGSPVSVVSRLVSEERDPSVETLKRIIEASDGAVCLDDFNAAQMRKERTSVAALSPQQTIEGNAA